jgi:cell division protein FtsQ
VEEFAAMQVDKVPVYREKSQKNRTNKKALFFLGLLFVTMLVLLFLRSPMSKISKIEVSGNELLSIEEVIKMSTLTYGSSFFSWNEQEVIERLKQLPQVDRIEIYSSFPGTIKIMITEHQRVAFEMKQGGEINVVLSDGYILKDKLSHNLIDRPILMNWDSNVSLREKLSYELGQTDESILQMISEISPDPSSAYPDKITLFTRDGYEIHATVSDLAANLNYYQIFSSGRKGQAPGVLYLLDAKYFRPYESVTK